MATASDQPDTTRLRQIARDVRACPELLKWPAYVGTAAGKLMVEVIDMGALAGDDHTKLRLGIALAKDRFVPSLRWTVNQAVWAAVASIFDSDDLSACGPVADLLEQEADRIDGEATAEQVADTSYQPAKQIQERYKFGNMAALRKFLDEHPEIRTHRPKTKAGKEDHHRQRVHIGDMEEAWRKHTLADPLDLPAETVDQAVSEIQRRKAEVDARRQE